MSAINDPIADMLTRIRNAQMAKLEQVSIPASKIKVAVAHVLKLEGFIRNFRCIRDGKQGEIRVSLKYDETGRSAITEIKRVSKPSCRRYVKSDRIPYIRNGLGLNILSTSKGVISDREARACRLGGEVICSVF